MAKVYVTIGYANTEENEYGICEASYTEYSYYGDLTRSIGRFQTTANKINDDISLSNELSIVADPFANENFYRMRYAELLGTKWSINSVEVQYPRLILSIGGVYNE